MKTHFILSAILIFCCICSNGFGQETFVKRIKTTYTDADIAIANNSDYFIAQTMNTGDSITGNDIYCTRINKNGKILWEKIYATNNSDTDVKLLGTSDNGIILVVKVYDETIKEYSAILIKCDSLGNKQWANKIIGSSEFRDISPKEIIEDLNGNYVLLYDLYLYKAGRENNKLQVAKFNISGQLVSQFGYDNLYSSSYSYYSSKCIAKTSNGGFVIGIEYFCSECENGPQTYIIQTNTVGKIISYRKASPKTYQYWDNNRPISIIEKNGAYYILGYYFNNTNYNPPYTTGEYYYWASFDKNLNASATTLIPLNIFALQKFFLDNNIRMPKVHTRGDVSYRNDFVFYDKEKFMMSYRVNLDKKISKKANYIVKYDSLGSSCNDYSIPKFDYDTSRRDFSFGEEIKGVTPFIDTLTITNIDISISSVNFIKNECSERIPSSIVSASSTGNITITKPASVFPNPAKNIISISYNVEKPGIVYLYVSSADGKQIQSIKTTTQKGINIQTVNVSSFAKGAYFIKVVGNGTQSIMKFIKE